MTTDPHDDSLSVPKRKLIEVALPLEAINRASTREKSIRHGHPSTLHLWWSRKPLATARAVLFAQLVDDPSSNPARFPTEEAQRVERERLHGIIERLVVWENTSDKALLAEAHEEILKSTGGNPPPILDPFAGGGSIPLEAQRLGLEAHASDLNPVAVLINKALIEIPPPFVGQPPVFPGVADGRIGGWERSAGLVADVRAYGKWLLNKAEQRIGHLYPKVEGKPVIAWIWARTVVCPNPVCGAEVPLISSLDLCRKPGKERWLRPVVADGRVEFEIASGARTAEPNKRGQGARFNCWVCDSAIAPSQVHDQLDVPTKPGNRLLVVVTLGNRSREYLAPTLEHRMAATAVDADAEQIRIRDDSLSPTTRGTFGGNAQGKRYGFFSFADYFTNRQLVVLTTLSDLVAEVRERVLYDALAGGLTPGDRLESGGTDGEAYADAVATYLGLVVSRCCDYSASICSWNVNRELIRNVFARQAVPMSWEFVETMLMSASAGGYLGQLEWVAKAIDAVPAGVVPQVSQADAGATLRGGLLSTDPPYYDNIGYADLSDFFYVWLRRSLRTVHPDLLSTLLVPKAQELVADRYRHNGKDGAKSFFEEGLRRVFASARETALLDFPIAIYYASKQSDSGDDGTASTGWETLLDGMIRSGWAITATWPMRSERGGRMLSLDTNALTSSIVLALRPRPDDAPTTDRRGLIAALHKELPDALRKLQQGAIAPVDLPQAAIGPGMAVFSRYAKVIEDDGTSMTVRSALARINEILDEVLNEQEGDFDAATRFALAWYRQHGYATGKFGVADDLARARNTAVETLVRDGILTSAAGKVTLLSPAKMPEGYDVLGDERVGTWEVLHHLIAFLERDGLPVAGAFLASAEERPDGAIDTELIKELAFLLFSIAEKNGWTQDALAFNTVATAWPDVVQAARSTQTGSGEQAAFGFEED